mgnify:CR=1 FL=1
MLENLNELLLIESGTSDVELADVFGDHWLLSFDLEVEFDIILDVGLHGLCAGSLAACLKLGDKGFAILDADKSKDKGILLVDKSAVAREFYSKAQLATYRMHRPQSSVLSQAAATVMEQARHALKTRPSR